MKKLFSMLLIVVLVCALGVIATGCNASSPSTDEGGKYSDAIPGGVGDVSEEVLAALSDSGKIKVYSCHLAGDAAEKTDAGAWWKEFYEYYKAVYNGEIDRVVVPWENWEDKYVVDFASGDAPDLIYAFEKNWPKLANRGMIFSVDEMKDKGVVGFDHPYLVDGLDQVDYIYTYKGKSYSFAKNMAEADMIFVNEDLFKKYQVKSPSEYYKEGTWNWVNFEKCCVELTRDTNADDVTDVFGYYGWDANFIVNAAGGHIITLKDNGELEVTMESVEAMQGFENVHSVYGKLKIAADANNFEKGTIGMIAWMPQNEYNGLFGQNDTDQYTFEWSMIPFPLDDRTNKTGIRSGKSRGWVVSSSASNIQGCINYLIAHRAFSQNNPQPGDKFAGYEGRFTEEQIQMIEDCSRNAVMPIYQGVGTLWHSQWDFWTNLKKSKTTVKEHIETYKSMFENQVILENESATN